MSNDEGLNYDFNLDLAQELVEYAMEMLENFPASERDDIVIDVLISSLSGMLLAYKIMNPNFTHKQLLDSACMKLKQDFFLKAGRDDFTIDLDCVN